MENLNSLIRKISVGPDYKSSSMHYVVGQSVLGGKYTIDRIVRSKTGEEFSVWIKSDEEEVFIWKTFVGMPVCIEFDIDF